jgi:hypothetical protein
MGVAEELLALEEHFWHVAGGDRSGYEAKPSSRLIGS